MQVLTKSCGFLFVTNPFSGKFQCRSTLKTSIGVVFNPFEKYEKKKLGARKSYPSS
jgi:hypothetical protein